MIFANYAKYSGASFYRGKLEPIRRNLMPDKYIIPDGISVRKYGNTYSVWFEATQIFQSKNKLLAMKFASMHGETWKVWERFLCAPTNEWAYQYVRQL